MTRLYAQQLTLAYGNRAPVVTDLDLAVPDGRISAIVGPNACGKSTLLRALSRLLRPTAGAVYLDSQLIQRRATKEVARELGLLTQGPTAPEGLTVADLVARGRFPHQRLLQRGTAADTAAVEAALVMTGTAELRDRRLDELSGGQRQRAWLALTLAQQTSILLLDEPTTFLDIAHQLAVLELVAQRNRTDGVTVVMVLHDLNQACRYADHLIAMRDGRIVAQGPPGKIVTAELIGAVFDVEAQVMAHPVDATPLCVPVRVAGGARIVARSQRATVSADDDHGRAARASPGACSR